MKKIAVILSGCGHRDGSEVTEAVSALIAISEMKAQFSLFAPEVSAPALNHLTGQAEGERGVLQEAARLARGKIKGVKNLQVCDFDALLFPGGFGAATVLCQWAQDGARCAVLPEIEKVIQDFYQHEKPIGAICIAPALIARVLGSHGITITIGKDMGVAEEVRKTGAHHESCSVEDFVTDRDHRIVTTPAYMYDHASPFQIFTGIRKAVRELVEMA